MELTDEFKDNVKAITFEARKFNSKIGEYEEHFKTILENTFFIVKLKNGSIKMSREYARDGLDSLNEEIIKRISQTFKPKA